MSQLDFEPPDRTKYPLIDLAYEAMRMGGVSGCILNAADEVAVAAFLGGRIPYPTIADIVGETLQACAGRVASSIDEVLECDGEARHRARELVGRARAPAEASAA